ncbi:SMI1/KNR4 family protein [Paenibacillus xylanivorans]|uniref:Cell wall assembly protein n=1 Tax=Paenibacillus xylanivorans TaxID=1705561 RepID=A0A0M9BMG4_9BACL|nr:SMI1/KNR4 family protein [Paenibacillus xylanivorans]KOY14302.1 cell wall assembly protein [Paenibacillus xylanivorans]
MNDERLERLEAWHEQDEFEEIVDAITEVPEEERDYILVNHLGRALSNMERYQEAVEQFLSVEAEGQNDPLWHYRIGLAYYYLEQYENAREAFEAADRLEPGDEDTQEFLEWIRNKTADELTEEVIEEPVDTVHSVTETIIEAAPGIHPESTSFWNDSPAYVDQYVLSPPTDEQIEAVEEQLVFKLPTFYMNMMKLHNGGVPHYRHFAVSQAESNEKIHIEILNILGIGREKTHSLCGEAGSRVIIEQGGYPEIGVVLSECPSDSEVVMLDYRESGNAGEPEVVHVNKAEGYKITWLAPNVETFIQGLVNEENQPANLEGSL